MGPKKDSSQKREELRLAELYEKIERQNERLNLIEGRLKKNEESIKDFGQNMKRVDETLTDLRRQNAKTCIILSGEDLPKKEKDENPLEIFCDQVKKKYGIRIPQNELSAAHRTGSGAIIGKFTKFHPGSGYYRLAVRRGKGSMNPNASVRVFANLKLTPFDSKIRFFASVARRVGTISFYEVQVSGHIAITVPITGSDRTRKITVKKPEDMKPYLTEEVLMMIEDSNKKRKLRKSKNKKDRLEDQQMDDLLRSEGDHGAEDAGSEMDVQ